MGDSDLVGNDDIWNDNMGVLYTQWVLGSALGTKFAYIIWPLWRYDIEAVSTELRFSTQNMPVFLVIW